MTYAELEAKAKRYLATFPDQTPEQIYINGFLAGYRERGDDEKPNGAEVPTRELCAEAVMMFNKTCTAFSAVKVLSDKRRTKLRVRFTEMEAYGKPLDVMRQVFEKMQASDFLRGGNARGWKASFDWLLVNDNNWVKVYEGQYDNRAVKADGKQVNDYWDE